MILALCGSLRAASINAALLRATARLAPPDIAITIYPHAGELPLFNPDNESTIPSHVQQLYALVSSCDAVVIASPEYAHGMTGTMKNMLDWLVGYAPFANKHVAVFNASPTSYHADSAVKEVLKTMSAIVVENASVRVPLVGLPRTEEHMVANPEVATVLIDALNALRFAVAQSSLVRDLAL